MASTISTTPCNRREWLAGSAVATVMRSPFPLPAGLSAVSRAQRNSTIAGRVGRLAGLLDLNEIAPGVRLRTVQIGETIDPGEPAARQRLPVPAGAVRVGREGGDGAADETRRLRDDEMRRLRSGVAPVRLRHFI